MTLSADAEKVTTKKVLLLLLLIGTFQPGLSDDEKNDVSYLPAPCIIYCYVYLSIDLEVIDLRFKCYAHFCGPTQHLHF